MCLRGHQSFKSHPVSANVDLAYPEGCLADAGPFNSCSALNS